MPAAPAQQPSRVDCSAPAVHDRREPFELIRRAKEQLQNASQGTASTAYQDSQRADSGWHLAVTVVELHRIPAATDVLASYEVDLDEVGDIVSYHRGKRYFRDQVGDIL